MRQISFYKLTEKSDFEAILEAKAYDSRWTSKKLYFLFVSKWDKYNKLLLDRISSLYPIEEDWSEHTVLNKNTKPVFIVNSWDCPDCFTNDHYFVSNTPTLVTLKKRTQFIVETYVPNIYDEFFNSLEFRQLAEDYPVASCSL